MSSEGEFDPNDPRRRLAALAKYDQFRAALSHCIADLIGNPGFEQMLEEITKALDSPDRLRALDDEALELVCRLGKLGLKMSLEDARERLEESGGADVDGA